MDNELMLEEDKVVENPQQDKEVKESDSLLSLLKEAAELSRASAIVNLAYMRAKSADKIREGYDGISAIIDAKVKAAIGTIRENSKLYDEIKAKKESIFSEYTDIIDTIESGYDKQIEDLLAEKARLESENVTLAVDNQNLRVEKKEKESKHRQDEKSQRNSDVSKAIAEKKAEAERLAKEGDLDGAQAAIEAYKKLNDSQFRESTGGMLEIAQIAQQIKLNSEKFRENQSTIKEIEEDIASLEEEKIEKIDKVCQIEEKELDKVDGKNSIFRRMALFASKALTKTFNKGKAINDQVFEPIKAKMTSKVSEVKEAIGTKISSIKENTAESFKNKLDKAIEVGKNVRQGAIDILKARIDKSRGSMEAKNQYLEDRSEK